MNNTVVQPDQQLSVIENSIEIFKQGPAILKANQEKTKRALEVGRSILQQWEDAWQIEDEEERLKALAAADERSNKYLVNCSAALDWEKEARKTFTQIMDEIKKMCTACENDIDKTKPGTIPAKVQSNRDNHASELYKIQDRKRKEAEQKAAKSKEAIEIKSTIMLRLSKYFNDYLLQQKQKLQSNFNALELTGFADKAAALRQYEPEYAPKHFRSFDPNIYSTLHTKEELDSLTADTLADKFNDYSEIYTQEMLGLKRDLVDKLPSKRAELLEQKRVADEQAALAERSRLAKLNEEEEKRKEELRLQKERLDAEQKQREQEESARLATEAEDAAAKAATEVEMQKQGDLTLNLFEQEAALADAKAPDARQGYEIIVTHQAGYVQIFQLWFENEGKNLPIDKIGNTKLDQMKAWAEKHAHKSNVKIESKFLKYEETFTAVNKKAK